MKKAWKRIGYCAVTSLAFWAAGQANAATVMSFIEDGPNQASDEDREYLINRFGGTTTLDVGDSLRGILDINTLNSGGANVGGTTGNNELTAVFQVVVSQKTFSFVDNDASGTFNAGDEYRFIYRFLPDPAFYSVALPGSTGALVPGLGAMAVLFEDATPDYAGDFDDPSAGSLALLGDDGTVHNAPHGTPGAPHMPPSLTDVGTAANLTEEAFLLRTTDGVHFMTLGFSGAAVTIDPDGVAGSGDEIATVGAATGAEGSRSSTEDAVWDGSSILSDDVRLAFAVTSGSAVANTNFALSLLNLGPAGFGLTINRATPVLPLGVAAADFALSQQNRGVNDLDTPYDYSSNTNISFNATVVPEPGTMILLGSGLLGIAGVGRRRTRKS